MSASNKTITIRQGCRYAWREWNIFWKLSPKFFYATFASAALTALSPYATVWLSAQLVGELSGGRDPHRLMVWVLWTLGTTAVLTLLRAAALHWKEAETDDLWQRQTRTYMDKQMSLDYVDEDSQRVYDMYSQIQQDARLSGAGGTICILLVEKIATALFQILGGVVLCWGLFTAAVPDGRLAFLGHPLFLAAFWAVMVCTACLSPVFAGQAAKYMPLLQESGKLGNRMFHVQFTLPEEPKNAPDLRMYDQYQNVVSGYMVGLWDAFARLRRGAMGIFRSASSAVPALLMGLVYLFVCLKGCGGAFGLDAVTQYLGAAANLFQGVVTLVNMLAEMETILENSRNMLYKTLWQLDQGESVRTEAALLKRYATVGCTKVADMALEIFAALGYTTATRVGRIWTDLRGNQLAGGTVEIMSYIAGRQILKRYAK